MNPISNSFSLFTQSISLNTKRGFSKFIEKNKQLLIISSIAIGIFSLIAITYTLIKKYIKAKKPKPVNSNPNNPILPVFGSTPSGSNPSVSSSAPQFTSSLGSGSPGQGTALAPAMVPVNTTSDKAGEKLILAVKGVKSGVALASALVNPLLGLMVLASEQEEGPQDLINIDKALSEGASIDYQEHNGYTALIYAAYKGYPGIAGHLLAKGANPEIKEKKGYNACTMAKYYLDRYTQSLNDNEAKVITPDFTVEKKTEMKQYYQQYISRYQQLVNMLVPVTHEHTKPGKADGCVIS